MDLQKHLATELLGSAEAKSILIDYIKSGRKDVVVKADPDVDGLFSYIECLNALRKVEELYGVELNIKSTINENRGHGYHEQDLEIKNSLIIVVDSSYSSSELELLLENENDVIVLDHHELENPSSLLYVDKHGYRAVTVNNQYDVCPDEVRYWSGCGVVENFFYGYLLNEVLSDVSIMHHGITLLSDVRDIENAMARQVLEVTFQTPIKFSDELNELVTAVYSFENSAFTMRPVRLTRNFIDYVFSPYFNASFQLNLGDYVLSLARLEWVTYIDSKKLRKKILEYMNSALKVQYLDYLTLIMVDLSDLQQPNLSKWGVTNYSLTNFLGLIANKYLHLGKTVLIVAKENGNLKRGSVRGVDSSVNYLEMFIESGFEARGHKQAFGIVGVSPRGVDFNRLRKLILENSVIDDKNGDNIIRLKQMLENLEDIKQIAYENQFLLSHNQKKIKYTGIKIGVSKRYKKLVIYDVDGLSVSSFDPELSFDKGYILPVHSEKSLELVLGV